MCTRSFGFPIRDTIINSQHIEVYFRWYRGSSFQNILCHNLWAMGCVSWYSPFYMFFVQCIIVLYLYMCDSLSHIRHMMPKCVYNFYTCPQKKNLYCPIFFGTETLSSLVEIVFKNECRNRCRGKGHNYAHRAHYTQPESLITKRKYSRVESLHWLNSGIFLHYCIASDG